MPLIEPARLRQLSCDIFRAIGTPDDLAQQVADSLVQSNLLGHDSHGVMRVPRYVQAYEQGVLSPAARPEITNEAPSTATVDGKWGFGNVTARRAAELAIQKARDYNVAAVAAVRCNHIGRLGEYTEMAARAGMIAFMVDGIFHPGVVAPFGGAARALGTNPLSFAVPAGARPPVVVDFATSVAAEGKLSVARSKKQQVPAGTILDRHGNPTNDPNDYYNGGMLLPFGGHKGYGLSLIVELLGRYLAGGEAYAPDQPTYSHVIVALNVGAFRPLPEYQALVDCRLDQIKAVPPASGFQEVMLPGEPERLTRVQRLESGIPIPEETWQDLAELSARLGVPVADR